MPHVKRVCECGVVLSQCRCVGAHEVVVTTPCTHRPTPLREKRIVLTCTNERCRYYDLKRTIAWPYLGNDVFFRPPFVCVCGFDLKPEEEEKSHGYRRT